MSEEFSKLFNVRGKYSRLCPECRIGFNSDGGRGRSEFNEEDGAVKYSTAAMVLDMILVDHSIDFRESPDQTMEKLFSFIDPTDAKSYSGTISIDEAGSMITVKWEGDKPGNWTLLIPSVLMSLSEHIDLWNKKYGTAMRDAFSDLKQQAADNSVSSETLARFCDTYCYGLLKAQSICIKHSSNESSVAVVKLNGDKAGIKTPEILLGLTPQVVNASEPQEKKEELPLALKYRINYDQWTNEDKAHIPVGILDTYVMNPKIETLAKIIKSNLDKAMSMLTKGESITLVLRNTAVNAVLMGPPGTGKTIAIFALGELLGLPVYSEPLSKNTEEDTFEGKNKIVQGKISPVSTDFVYGYSHGGIVDAEEFNLVDPGVTTGALNQALEYPFIIMKDGYQRTQRHPLTVVIATMNTGGIAGTKKLNPSLSSRLPNKFFIDAPKKQDFINVLASKGYPMKRVRKVYEIYTNILKYMENNNNKDLCENLSTRQCFAALNQMEAGISLKEAIENTIVGSIAESDVSIAEEIEKTIVDGLPDMI